MDETERIFAERLLKVMKERGLTYKQVEALTGVPDSSLHDYTHCKVSVSLETAKKIADGLDINLDWMVGIGSRLKKIAN